MVCYFGGLVYVVFRVGLIDLSVLFTCLGVGDFLMYGC